MTLIALFAAGSSPTLLSPSVSAGQKKKPTTAFYLFAALFDSAAYGHSASWFHRYINETNPRCVFFLRKKKKKVAPKKKDDISSPVGVAPNASQLVRAGMCGS